MSAWIRRLVVPLAAAVGTLAGIAGCRTGPALQPVTFLTNYVFIGRHAPFFVGVEKGYYREAGIALDIQPATGSAFVLSALEGGQADYGIAEAASLVQAIGRGSTARAFGVYMDVSTSGLASLEPYPTPADLQGRRVAASLTDSARVILPIILTGQGLAPSSVTWLAADPSTYFSLLLSRQADLVTASSDSDVPALRRVAEPRGETVHFASFAEWGYDVYGYFLVARADRLAERPEEARRFAAATVAAVRDAREQPEAAARALAAQSPTLDQDAALAQWRASLPAFETASVREHGYGIATEARLQRSIDFVQQAFEVPAALAPADIYVRGIMPGDRHD